MNYYFISFAYYSKPETKVRHTDIFRAENPVDACAAARAWVKEMHGEGFILIECYNIDKSVPITKQSKKNFV